MNTEYANMAPAALAGPRYVRLWIDEASVIRQADPLPAGLDKIVWQAGGHVYWFEMTEPTLQNVRDGIDSVLERGHGYRALVGATKQGTGLLHEDPEQPLPLAEMIPISTDVHVRTWWAMNTQSEPMDMLFYGHRTQGDDGTPAPVGFDFASRHNRDPSPDGSQDSDGSDDDDNDDNMSVGNQPESSAAAARRAPNRSTAQGTGAVHPSHSTDVDESESDSDAVSDAGFSPPPSKQAFTHLGNLDTRALKPSRIGRETDRKKASVLPSLTAVSSSSKRNLAAMAELDELNSPADPAEPPRKVARLMLATDSSVEVEPERSHGEFNSSQQPTNRLIPPISPPPLASSPSHDLAPTAVEQVQVRASAEHLLMLASGVGQPAEPSVTQVGTPGRTRSPSNPRSGDPLANMMVPDAGRESGPASPASESSSGYFTASKSRLPLPSFSSMLAAETDVWSPLRSVSALA